MNTHTLQKVLDHWHVGKIIKFKECAGYFRLTTNQGVFFAVDLSRTQWSHGNPKELALKALPQGSIVPISPPDFCHVGGYHYCLFKEINKM